MATPSEDPKKKLLEGEAKITDKLLNTVAKYVLPDKLWSLAIDELQLAHTLYTEITAGNTHPTWQQRFSVSSDTMHDIDTTETLLNSQKDTHV